MIRNIVNISKFTYMFIKEDTFIKDVEKIMGHQFKSNNFFERFGEFKVYFMDTSEANKNDLLEVISKYFPQQSDFDEIVVVLNTPYNTSVKL